MTFKTNFNNRSRSFDISLKEFLPPMLNELDNLFVTDSAAGNVVVIDDVDVVGIQLSKVVEGLAVEVAAEANHPHEVGPDGLEGH